MIVARFNRFAAAASLLVAVLALGCEPEKPKGLLKSAKFGVFFGGQVEERKEIPFELDAAKQLQGFRVEFSEPLTTDTTELEWRIDLPKVADAAPKEIRARRRAPSPKTSSPRCPATTAVHAGQTRFDHATSFRPGDPLGLWTVRVVVKGKVVIDRPVEVFDPVRERALASRRWLLKTAGALSRAATKALERPRRYSARARPGRSLADPTVTRETCAPWGAGDLRRA